MKRLFHNPCLFISASIALVLLSGCATPCNQQANPRACISMHCQSEAYSDSFKPQATGGVTCVEQATRGDRKFTRTTQCTPTTKHVRDPNLENYLYKQCMSRYGGY